MAQSYGQVCPVARALDIIGEKWSLLITRDLLRHGPLRFQEMEQRLPGIAPNTLSARLKLLEEKKVIGSRRSISWKRSGPARSRSRMISSDHFSPTMSSARATGQAWP